MGDLAVEIAGEQRAALSPILPTVAVGATGLDAHILKHLSASEDDDPSHLGFNLDVQFSVPPGITIVFGASGSGKTTLLNCLAGLLTPDAGRIAVAEHVFFERPPGRAPKVNSPPAQRRIGYVFQDLALFPHLTVRGNVEYGLGKFDPDERSLRADNIVHSLNIAHLLDRRPGDISGGERQRVALARALVIEPCLLLLDEPLAALDAPTKSSIVKDLRIWNDLHRVPILYVTHSREEVFALGERVLFMEKGKLLSQGTPHEVLETPRQEMVAQLAGFENIFDARVSEIHERQGTMTCALDGAGVHLEAPLTRVEVNARLRLAVRAGDILVAAAQPQSLSARNIIAGKITSLVQRDFMVIAQVDCGALFEVHLTPGARDSLQLESGKAVWLVIKTHSCHLVRP